MTRIDWSRFDWSSLGRGWLEDIRAAAAFFTVLPLAARADASSDEIAGSLRAWPIVGACIASAGAVAYFLATALGLAPLPCALIALGVTVALTGALHEDGFADFADGLGGGDAERRLAIMQDSHIGVFGVSAVTLSLTFRAAVLAQLSTPARVAAGLIAASAVSRGLAPLMTLMLAPARGEGLGAMLGEIRQEVVAAAAILAALAAFLLLGVGAGIGALALGMAAVFCVASLARSRLGGYTGDVLGAAQQAAEMAVLVAVAIFP
jgi:adenosylcobinamide-GDP ribazoletransferase